MMKRLFSISPVIPALLAGILLIPGSCSPAPQTPVVQPVPTPPPPTKVFITSNLTIQPQAVRPGYTAEISVMVTNTGGQPGTYTVVLNIDGNPVQNQDVTLAGGASQKVTFLFSTFNEKDYEVTIDQLQGTLEVLSGA